MRMAASKVVATQGEWIANWQWAVTKRAARGKGAGLKWQQVLRTVPITKLFHVPRPCARSGHTRPHKDFSEQRRPRAMAVADGVGKLAAWFVLFSVCFLGVGRFDGCEEAILGRLCMCSGG